MELPFYLGGTPPLTLSTEQRLSTELRIMRMVQVYQEEMEACLLGPGGVTSAPGYPRYLGLEEASRPQARGVR